MIKLTRFYGFQNENYANKDALVENFTQLIKRNEILRTLMKDVKEDYPSHEAISKYWYEYLKKEESPLRIKNRKTSVTTNETASQEEEESAKFTIHDLLGM